MNYTSFYHFNEFLLLEAVYLSRLIFVRDKSVLVAASGVSPSYSKQILLNKE